MKITDESLEKAITKKSKLEKSKEALESQYGSDKIQVLELSPSGILNLCRNN